MAAQASASVIPATHGATRRRISVTEISVPIIVLDETRSYETGELLTEQLRDSVHTARALVQDGQAIGRMTATLHDADGELVQVDLPALDDVPDGHDLLVVLTRVLEPEFVQTNTVERDEGGSIKRSTRRSYRTAGVRGAQAVRSRR